MGAKENGQLLRDVWAALASGDFGVVEKAYDANVKYHGPDGETSGIKAVTDLMKMYKTAFPDLTITVEQVVADDDYAVARAHPSGTNTGPLGDMPATGKKISMEVINMCRFANGRIVEEWEQFDRMELMSQLGMTG